MFLCEPCFQHRMKDANRQSSFFGTSNGACEDCGEKTLCADAPSSYLPIPSKNFQYRSYMPKTKTVEDLSRPSIEVKIPQVRLQLKDLAFLRSLAQPDAIHCAVGEIVKDRLRFLDLIARANVPPSAEKVKEAEKEKEKLLLRLHLEIAAEKWEAVTNTSYELKRNRDRLLLKPEDVLTPKGEQILRTGEVVVRARKVGCV